MILVNLLYISYNINLPFSERHARQKQIDSEIDKFVDLLVL